MHSERRGGRGSPRSTRFSGLGVIRRHLGGEREPALGEHIARVGLEGRGPAELASHWEGELDGSRIVDVPLPPGGRVTLDLKTPKDEFWPDNRGMLVVPERKLPRVLVVSPGAPSAFLAAALQALEKTGVIVGPLGRTTPEHAVAAARAYDVLIFDRCAPPERIPAVRALFLAPPQATSLLRMLLSISRLRIPSTLPPTTLSITTR